MDGNLIWQGVVIGAVGGAIGGLVVWLCQCATTKLRLYRDSKAVLNYLVKVCRREVGHYKNVSDICNAVNLPIERVNSICGHDQRFMGEDNAHGRVWRPVE